MAEQGVSIEILDLRTLVPIDVEAILTTARKTGKVLIVHEATRTGGIGGEVAAIVSEGAFDHLDGPIPGSTAPRSSGALQPTVGRRVPAQRRSYHRGRRAAGRLLRASEADADCDRDAAAWGKRGRGHCPGVAQA